MLLEMDVWRSWLLGSTIGQSLSTKVSQIGPYQMQEVIYEGERCSVVLALHSAATEEVRVACKLTAAPAYDENSSFALSPIGLEWQFYNQLQQEPCPPSTDSMDCRHDLLLRALTTLAGVECTNTDGLLYTTNMLVLEEAATTLDALLLQGPFQEAHALVLFEQLLSAVGTLHRHRICHRDLKPCQILFSKEGALKLADLDLAAFFKDFRSPHVLEIVTQDSESSWEVEMLADGTAGWMAPEVKAWANWRWDETRPPYYGIPTAADLWGCGQILACMLLGIENLGENTTRSHSGLSNKARELVSGLLEADRVCRFDVLVTRQFLAQYWADFGRPNDAEVTAEVISRLRCFAVDKNEEWMVVEEPDNESSWTLV